MASGAGAVAASPMPPALANVPAGVADPLFAALLPNPDATPPVSNEVGTEEDATDESTADAASAALIALLLPPSQPLPAPAADSTVAEAGMPAAGSQADAFPVTIATPEAGSRRALAPQAGAAPSNAVPDLPVPDLATDVSDVAGGTGPTPLPSSTLPASQPPDFVLAATAAEFAAASAPQPSVAAVMPPAPTGATPHAAASAPMPPAAPPALDLLATDWTATLGEHIAWSAAQGDGEAQVELHPAELGSLTIRVETQGDQARVSIVAAEPAARELLQQSLPLLRDLMNAQGLNLARAQVERPSSSRGQADGGASDGRSSPTSTPMRRRVTQVQLVDAYA
jgi:flagellar hook-length control protein FliK